MWNLDELRKGIFFQGPLSRSFNSCHFTKSLFSYHLKSCLNSLASIDCKLLFRLCAFFSFNLSTVLPMLKVYQILYSSVKLPRRNVLVTNQSVFWTKIGNVRIFTGTQSWYCLITQLLAYECKSFIRLNNYFSFNGISTIFSLFPLFSSFSFIQ